VTKREPLPPWLIHPDIAPDSIGWRMGDSQGRHDEFYRWFSSLTDAEAVKYEERYPEPHDWRGNTRKSAHIRGSD
jgi:hypothetical protein